MSESAIKVGFGKASINPEPGVGLGGHFGERPNTGVYDDLNVKVCLIQSGDKLNGIASYDLLGLPDAFIARVRKALSRKRYSFAKTIPLCCTHTHTGPDIGGVFDCPGERYPEYSAYAARRTVEAVEAALKNLAPAELLAGSVMDNPLAFNRRYWMKNGRVVTNPGYMNPDTVRPEGDIDPEIAVMAVHRNGKIAGVIANISNHTDSTAGDKVSADWPGHFERAVKEKLGADVNVMVLIRPAGNVNQTNVFDPHGRVYGLDIASQLGRGYADIVLKLCAKLAPVNAEVEFKSRVITVKKRKFTAEQLAEARALANTQAGTDGVMTAEDLAKDEKAADKWFAQQLLKYIEWMPERGRKFPISVLKFNKDLGLVFLPGEPFNEIARSIRMISPCRTTIVASLANGAAGYVPYRECFDRGGYEICAIVGGGPAEDTAELYIKTASDLLNK